MATSKSKSKTIAAAEDKFTENTSAAPIVDGATSTGEREIKKKYWRIEDKRNRHVLEFFPLFLVNPESGEVECRNLEMSFTDEKGVKHDMLFDWLNVYMFIYYTANEELRQQLATRYERKVNYIPYDVKIPVTQADLQAGSVGRRIELPVDELTMAIARDEAFTLLMKNKAHWNDPSFFRYKNK